MNPYTPPTSRQLDRYQRMAPGLNWKEMRAQLSNLTKVVEEVATKDDREARLIDEVRGRMQGRRQTTAQRLVCIQEFMTKPCSTIAGVSLDQQKDAIIKYICDEAALAKDVLPLMELVLHLDPERPAPYEFIPHAMNRLQKQPDEALEFIKRRVVAQNNPGILLDQLPVECVTPRLLQELVDYLPKTSAACNLIFAQGGKERLKLIEALHPMDEDLALAYVSAGFEEFACRETPKLEAYFMGRIAKIPNGKSEIVAYWLDPCHKEESTLTASIDEALWEHLLRLGYPQEVDKLLQCVVQAPHACDFRSLMARGWEPQQEVIDALAKSRKLSWEHAPQFAVRVLEAGMQLPDPVLGRILDSFPEDASILDDEVTGGSAAQIGCLVRLVRLGLPLERPLQVDGKPVLPMILLFPEYAVTPMLTALSQQAVLAGEARPDSMEVDGLSLV